MKISASGALRCAMDMQQKFRSEPVVPLRIGIHIGEILFENNQPVGDGVNIVSRIESLGQAGTIFFSKNVYDKVRNLPEFSIGKLGHFELKNLDESIEVHALANEGFPVPQANSLHGKLKLDEGVSKTKSKIWLFLIMLGALIIVASIFAWNQWASNERNDSLKASVIFEPTDKSIGVLPFKDLSPQGDHAYFGDGISEEILNALAQLEDLKVIGRSNSLV